VTGYGLDDWGFVSGRDRDISLPYNFKTGPGPHPAFCSVGTKSPLPWSVSIWGMKLTAYPHSHIYLHGVVLKHGEHLPYPLFSCCNCPETPEC